MTSMKFYLFVLVIVNLIGADSSPLVAQEKEKQKPGTTVDAWRQSLPRESQAPEPAEGTPDPPPSLQSNAEATKTLLALERLWMDSLKVGDADSLSQIIFGDFAFVSPRMIDGKDRVKYLEYALRDLKLISYEFDKITVRLFGKTAIVTGLLKQNATMKGEDWGGNYLVTDVWINRNGTWRAVSRHEDRLKEQK